MIKTAHLVVIREFICMNSFLFGSIRGAAVDQACWQGALVLVVDVRHTVKAQLSSLVCYVVWNEFEVTNASLYFNDYCDKSILSGVSEVNRYIVRSNKLL